MIVVSVGPYPLWNRRPGAQRATRSGGHASPPTTTVSRSSSPVGSTDARAAGVTNAWVTRSLRSSSASSSPPYTDGGATTIVDPDPTASNSSSTDASKLGDAKCRVRAAGVSR